MVGVAHLVVALNNKQVWGKNNTSKDYQIGANTAKALYGHSRLKPPYGLTVLGY